MQDAVFHYRCRQCGASFADAHTGVSMALAHLTAALLDVKTLGQSNTRAIDKMAIHHCDETHVGLADLMGYQIEGS